MSVAVWAQPVSGQVRWRLVDSLPYQVPLSHAQMPMNWLGMMIDCTSCRGTRKPSYELCMWSCAHTTVYYRFALLQIWVCLIVANKCIFKAAWVCHPWSNGPDLWAKNWVHSISTSNCISRLAPLWPPSPSKNGINVNLWVQLMSVSMGLSRVAQSVSPCWQHHGIQYHHHIIMLTWSRPPSLHDGGLRLQSHTGSHLASMSMFTLAWLEIQHVF